MAEWYHTWLWTLVWCAVPWAVGLSLGDNKLFIGPKQNIYAFSWFYLVYLIWYYYLSSCELIVKQNIENKQKSLFKKKSKMRKIVFSYHREAKLRGPWRDATARTGRSSGFEIRRTASRGRRQTASPIRSRIRQSWTSTWSRHRRPGFQRTSRSSHVRTWCWWSVLCRPWWSADRADVQSNIAGQIRFGATPRQESWHDRFGKRHLDHEQV